MIQGKVVGKATLNEAESCINIVAIISIMDLIETTKPTKAITRLKLLQVLFPSRQSAQLNNFN